MQQSISTILVLGAGSAGLLAALTLKKKLPAQVAVRIVRSPRIGIIGVGEGTTPNFPSFLFDFLKLDQERFFREVHPVWKRGIHFIWGPRGEFPYAFGNHYSVSDTGFSRSNGFYSWEKPYESGFIGRLMQQRKVFLPDDNEHPRFDGAYGYHLENPRLVAWLEGEARRAGVTITDAEITGAGRDGDRVTHLNLEGGGTVQADFYVDASGFRSELLRGALEEPFESFANSLICDRAVVGGWERQDGDPIQPFTTAETMPAGWSWRIDHRHHVNRGYVYSSSFTSDEEAERVFRERNPLVTRTRVVPFISGHYRRSWVGNVCAVGNSSGFVEPMEATALMVLCMELRALAASLLEARLEVRESLVDLYNRFSANVWEEIRSFLMIHYKFNTLMDTPFWKHCQELPLSPDAARIVEFFRENGPSSFAHDWLLPRTPQFGVEGWWALLVGQGVPWNTQAVSPDERRRWAERQVRLEHAVRISLTTEQALAIVDDPAYWQETEAAPVG
ncbi:tryptophan 7-halogenase [Luteolibacter arcticus]|uniref:Tryptophan 7-halogenase n=1 Tax=Luteolibacter arcticus TaxID=1581411 RepID=A0ABT3GLI4_9BACT|nr:tryptophan 7-halogenase [Luteolibacter arcticus]MCW1924389.1 tryptophan 7-halogenase [Luteolibacter arcticus]